MSISETLDARTWRSSATLRTLKIGVFGTPFNSIITVVTVALLGWIVPPLLRWSILDATWTGTSADCALATGACRAFVGAKVRFTLFAFYPPALQWRR
ncbi:hypothetical protein BPNPMPFG_006821 (plasmid) [Mesorhizobium sp. AR07]|uniref:hypothetical protein n=1 Tax=Mesorhizobium sp. AR07 TaxID=2865838 RepID=UPI00215EC24B|nr:hypothetical protein [Mesorhizobium sp. AR07]UVK49318.1 hypothetical protein BPNPMPFG_006821 [Mesorhizobium sp. AR07]